MAKLGKDDVIFIAGQMSYFDVMLELLETDICFSERLYAHRGVEVTALWSKNKSGYDVVLFPETPTGLAGLDSGGTPICPKIAPDMELDNGKLTGAIWGYSVIDDEGEEVESYRTNSTKMDSMKIVKFFLESLED